MDDLLREVIDIFVAEAREQADRIAQALLTMEQQPASIAKDRGAVSPSAQPEGIVGVAGSGRAVAACASARERAAPRCGGSVDNNGRAWWTWACKRWMRSSCGSQGCKRTTSWGCRMCSG